MFHFSTANTDIVVYTFKEGVLASAAHDLKLDVTQIEGQASEDGLLMVKINASSLVPCCAVKNGKEIPGALSTKDLKKIADTMQKQVLDVRRFPTVLFEAELSELKGSVGRGTLTLKGKSRKIALTFTQFGEDIVAKTTVHQPDFGIRPYTAMLGALKIKPNLHVHITLKDAAPWIKSHLKDAS